MMGPTNGIPGVSMPSQLQRKPQRRGPTNGTTGTTGAHGTTMVARVEVQDVVPAHGGQPSALRAKGVAREKAVEKAGPLEKAVGRGVSTWTIGAADTSKAATSTSVDSSGRFSAAF